MIWQQVISEEAASIPDWVEASDAHLTLVKIGYVNAASLMDWKGANDEHLLFSNSPTGRMTQLQWDDFLADLAEGNTEPVLLIRNSKGEFVHEGNHRIRACAQLKQPLLVVLRCFAGLSEPD